MLSSVAHKFGYHLCLQYPSDVKPAAERLEEELWGMLKTVTGLYIPRVDEGLGVKCCLDISSPSMHSTTSAFISGWADSL